MLVLCRRLALQVGIRWQDATLADIWPLLVDVATGPTPEQERDAAKRLVAMGALQLVDDDG